MTHNYTITGMTCNGCKASVEKALQSIKHVTDVSVNLEAAEATIHLSQRIPIEQLQGALSDKFKIQDRQQSKEVLTASGTINDQKSEWKQLFPLFLIFGYISAAAIIINYKPWDGSSFMLDFMGLFYIVFSFFKLLDLKGFPESFKMYDPLAKAIPSYGFVYPFIELALGVLFLTRLQIPLALIVTIVILGITTIGVTKTLLSKKAIQCACLGTALKLPMTKATFIENTIMLIMAVWMLIKIYN
ncbi:heavy-metal-associated domain-containing protein [Psychroserpens sp. NJDZ02]|uniref:heavy-metal-associated domain-containing protein n=1 Tax=Psychroserpens sp. NJDZ02 TaxID=2570561 RepID=UPI0010A80D46|nr:heavy metal-associated domain-containing protein [Psychroserpens sp. NJDZ02]QCE42308.1 heavy metal transporter [Psychroserpens sp. NJDZ02]